MSIARRFLATITRMGDFVPRLTYRARRLLANEGSGDTHPVEGAIPGAARRTSAGSPGPRDWALSLWNNNFRDERLATSSRKYDGGTCRKCLGEVMIDWDDGIPDGHLAVSIRNEGIDVDRRSVV